MRRIVRTVEPTRYVPSADVTATTSGSQLAEAGRNAVADAMTKPERVITDLYDYWGKTYRKKYPYTMNVNANWSIEDVQEYVARTPPEAEVPKYDCTREVPYESIDDFVATLSQASSVASAAF